ncbi:MAG: zinc ribbon domain-containing protein [Caldimicrobium sp.]|nr:zinc ribbon domain-containing protein [Caldimicrobium sp.]MCX7614028.1 zinc ribbon domain-containing protein [Caldimicrobium sp.]MDW8182895.1 zinc ribbon domain-containing protein [Caldimicrobium sp.]
MPIFEFRCSDCEEVFEVLLKSKEEVSGVTCKVCGSTKIERLMSVVNSIIGSSSKGSGGDKPRIAESHTCPSGTCTHLELPGHTK